MTDIVTKLYVSHISVRLWYRLQCRVSEGFALMMHRQHRCNDLMGLAFFIFFYFVSEVWIIGIFVIHDRFLETGCHLVSQYFGISAYGIHVVVCKYQPTTSSAFCTHAAP